MNQPSVLTVVMKEGEKLSEPMIPESTEVFDLLEAFVDDSSIPYKPHGRFLEVEELTELLLTGECC